MRLPSKVSKGKDVRVSIDLLTEALRRNFDAALSFIGHALRDTPDELWEAELWKDGAPGDGALWNVAYHALWYLDFDLVGGFRPWAPPEQFRAQADRRDAARVFTRDDLRGYIRYCRTRVDDTLAGLTEEAAAMPLPRNHRHGAKPYGVWLASIPGHVIEHGSQIRQFITMEGVEPSADGRHQLQSLRDAVRGASDDDIARWASNVGGYKRVIGMVVQSVPIAFEFDDLHIAAAAPVATVRSTPQDLLRLVAGEPATGAVAIDGDQHVFKST